MNSKIDMNYNFSSEIKSGSDPDRYSPTLRSYHKSLWSKELPNKHEFELNDVYPNGYLYYESAIGHFDLRSDAITHSYKNTKRMAHIIDNVPSGKVDSLFYKGCTIGSYIIFPKNKIKGQQSINQARGCNHKIADRFDLTLECIRLFYSDINSPLYSVFERHSDFFRLFVNFKGYVDFFLLQDLVLEDYSKIRYWLNHESFETKPMPQSVDEYLEYRRSTLDFIQARGCRMEASSLIPQNT